MNRSIRVVGTLTVAIVLFTANFAAAASIALNGSFENGSFVNTNCNYMQLNAGDTALTGWTIVNPVVWGRSPCDAFLASDGIAFVDLSGFGGQSPNGTLEQLLGTSAGQLYQFSFDSLGTLAGVTVDSNALALTPGASVGGWTTYTGSFTATGATSTLRLLNPDPSSQIVFVDNISVDGSVPAVVPEPASLTLLGPALAGLLVRARRRR